MDHGSSELMASYKHQIQSLNARITELEEESRLATQVLNLENEIKIKLAVQNYNSSIKESGVTIYKV